jgi:hypothetical protein
MQVRLIASFKIYESLMIYCFPSGTVIPVIERDPVTRQFPCPCGLAAHARATSANIHHLANKNPHPTDPDACPDSDDEISVEKGAYTHSHHHVDSDSTPCAYDMQVDDRSTTSKSLPSPLPHSSVLESCDMQVDDPSPTSQHPPGLHPNSPVLELPTISDSEQGPMDELSDHETFESEPVLDDLINPEPEIDSSMLLSDDPDLPEASRAYLEQRGILVEDRYKLTICIDCGVCIEFKLAYGHRYASHRNSKADTACLGSNELLVNHLKQMGAHHPCTLPSVLPEAIPLLPVVTAFRCALPACQESKIFLTPKRLSEHFRHSHPQVPAKHRPRVTLYAQRIGQFRGRTHYIEVPPPSLQNVHPRLEHVLSHSRELGLGNKHELYQGSKNVRAKNEFLSTTRWDSILENVKLCQLRLSVAPPSPTLEPMFVRLIKIVRKYYHDIAQGLEFTLTNLVLRYLHSQDPEYVAMV